MAAKKKGAKPKPPKADAEPELSRFQAFKIERMPRSALTAAPYNPRTITPEAKKRLKRNLEKVGLLEPVILNRTTGRLLGGHQRLACLDALEGSDRYLLDVSVVELSETEEREQNVALNNSALQGDWQMDALAELLKTPGLQLDQTGWTPQEIQLNFDDPELATIFAPNEPTKRAVAEVQALKADAAAQKRAERAGSTPDDSEADLDGESAQASLSDDRAPPGSEEAPAGGKGKHDSAARAFRKKGQELFDKLDDTEVMAVIIFRSREERENFVESMGADRNDRYVDGQRVVERLAGEWADNMRDDP